MKNVQIVFNIQVPDHVTEQEVSAKLNQVISSLMAQEFGSDGIEADQAKFTFDDHDGQIGHA